MSDWGSVCEDLDVQVSQESRTTQEAEALRSSSDSEDDVQPCAASGPVSSGPVPRRPSLWWARQIWEHTQDAALAAEAFWPSKPVKVLSACTGTCAEGAVFKAFSIPFTLMSASDSNMNCKMFVDKNLAAKRPTHWFKTMRDQANGCSCLVHPYALGCEASPESADVFIAGAPCHPFSTQRCNRFQKGSVQDHEEYEATMSDLLSILQQAEPAAVVSEQVLGFKMKLHSAASEDETPLKLFLEKLAAVSFKHGGYYVVTHELDMRCWLTIARPRIYMAMFRKDKYSRSDVQKFNEHVRALVERQLSSTPRQLHDVLLAEDHPAVERALGNKAVKDEPGSSSATAARQWESQAAALRSKAVVPKDYAPWTSHKGFQGRGLRPAKRSLEMLDLGFIHACKRAKMTLNKNVVRSAKENDVVKDFVVDISQNPVRRPWSSRDGLAHTLTTSTKLYSYRLDRMLAPLEHLVLQGYSADADVEGLSDDTVRSMAGEGMALPCLATIIYSMCLTKGFALG